MRVGLNPMYAVLRKGGTLAKNTDTRTGKTACDNESRDGDKHPKVAGKPPEAGQQAQNRSSLTAPEGHTSADTSISEF